MPKICDDACPGGDPCPYEVCPFIYEWQNADEIVSGYKYAGSQSDFEDGTYEREKQQKIQDMKLK